MENISWVETHWYIFILIAWAVILMLILIAYLCWRKKIKIVYDRAEFKIADGILKRYIGNALEVYIPEGVESIGGSAFYKNQRIRKVFNPGSVKEIGAEAFYGCEMLSDIQFAEGLSGISDRAFYGCTSLQKLVLPQSISTIGAGAFSHCSLNEIHFRGNNLSGIDSEAFDAAFKSQPIKIFVPSLSAWLTQKHRFISCRYNLYVNNVLLESVKITSDVPSSSFANCISLKSVTLSARVPSGCFSDCTSLESATISANVPESCFYGCGSLKSIQFESAVEEIGKKAFVGCPISSLYIPQNIVVIGSDAFNSCENLKEVKIPSAYRERVYSIFYGCRDIKFEFYD